MQSTSQAQMYFEGINFFVYRLCEGDFPEADEQSVPLRDHPAWNFDEQHCDYGTQDIVDIEEGIVEDEDRESQWDFDQCSQSTVSIRDNFDPADPEPRSFDLHATVVEQQHTDPSVGDPLQTIPALHDTTKPLKRSRSILRQRQSTQAQVEGDQDDSTVILAGGSRASSQIVADGSLFVIPQTATRCIHIYQVDGVWTQEGSFSTLTRGG